MKKILSLLLFLLPLSLMANRHAGPVGDDNGNGEPTGYTLQCKVSPIHAGSTYFDEPTVCEPGKEYYTYAYENTGFKFQCWKDENGTVLSTERGFYYTMPERDVVLTAYYIYDPATPADPQTPVPVTTYKLKCNVFPAHAGSTNYDSPTDCVPGQEYYNYAYVNTGFKFQYWRDESGEVLSTEQGFYYTMPERDVVLTAVYKYDPQTPSNPSANYYNAETKTLIIDDFKPGYLYSVCENALSRYGITKEDVVTIQVIGQLGDYDAAYAGYYATSIVDLSRTTGLETFTSMNNNALASIILPESVTAIDYWAFNDSEALQSLTLFSYEPPQVNEHLLEQLNPAQVIVYVPASALGLYIEHAVWGQYTILPITADVCNVTVSLPNGTTAQDLQNCYIDLVNAKNGQKVTYLITNATSYTFFNTIKHTLWNAYLYTAEGNILGEITGIAVDDEDVEVQFENINLPHTVTAHVMCGNHDITEQATVQWYTADGIFIAQGTQLPAQPDGRQLVVTATVEGFQYQSVDPAHYTVGDDGSYDVYLIVEERTPMLFSVIVTDENNEPIDPETTVYVTLSQQVSKSVSNHISSTVAGEEGSAEVEYYEGIGFTLNVIADGYIGKTINIKADETGAIDMPYKVQLTKVEGTKIWLYGTATLAAPKGQTPVVVPAVGEFEQFFEYFNYSLVNKTTGEPITEFGRTGATITLFEQLPEGTEIEVTATLMGGVNFAGQLIEVAPAVGTGVVTPNGCSVDLNVTQRGALLAILTPVAAIPAMLFDANGNFLLQKEYKDGIVSFANLPDGEYHFVTMMREGQGSVSQLSRLDDLGLTAGTDYVLNNVTITTGVITQLGIQYVKPAVAPEPEFLEASTSFSVNKSECVVGNYVTLSANLQFKGEVAGQVSNVQVIFDLQDKNDYVNNSCLLNNALSMITYTDHQLVVPVASATSVNRIRFCTIPTDAATYAPTAYVRFTYNNKEYLKPIGQVSFAAKSLDFAVQKYTADGLVTARGLAPASSTVEVFDGNVPVGTTTALSNGQWSIHFKLAGEPGTHYVHAEVTNIKTAPGSRLFTETKDVLWDESMILPTTAGFQFFNGWLHKTVGVTFDLLACSVSETSYMFYTTAEFTFTTKFTGNGPQYLDQVIINVWLENGDVMPLEGKYDAINGQYVATATFDWGNLPANMNVDWVVKGGNKIVLDHSYSAITPCTYKITAIHDPSGYVYEAVSSNRVEGATASAYYKETVYNMYDDPEEQVVLWDAKSYGQVNPQVTDAEGTYHWDVPQGLWQVKFEKTGYETTYSDWLPVPPPQMEINIPMKQLVLPKLKSVKAYDDQIDIEFSLYMQPQTLTADYIQVTVGDEKVAGSIELVNEEAVSDTDPTTYARRVRFIPADPQALIGQSTLTLFVNQQVKAYNNLLMEQNYNQPLSIEARVHNLDADKTLQLSPGAEKTIAVTALPAAAAAGKTIIVATASDDIAKVEVSEYTLDQEGKASVAVKGGMQGTTVVTILLDGTTVEAETTVTVRFIKGDVNGDGAVDIADVVAVYNIMAGNNQSGYNGDVNEDGAVDIADVVAIYNIMAGR